MTDISGPRGAEMRAQDGQRVLLTGASGGIGRAIAIAFSHAGATVGLAGRDADALKETSENCPGRTEILRFDAANPDSCAQAAADAERLMGGVDVLVHGAGISMTSRFLRTSSDSMQQLMSINFESSWWLTQGVLPGMLDRRRGTVLFINSLAGKTGFGQVAAYVASKHAQLGLMRALAVEYAKSGVNFNAVCPYYVDTPMTERTVAEIATKTNRTADAAQSALHSPQGSLIDPRDIGELCLFLASEHCRGLNGQAINVDGGKLQ
ncbi:SDR family oxidoreductase [Streptomyces sp. NPDC001982]|uniref:SDR family NAD(P)-dependent oxidoreductase n=1 Tax=Streptomyces sp. NPDC001982 TaxID=3154405 RepID=UPI0033319BE9